MAKNRPKLVKWKLAIQLYVREKKVWTIAEASGLGSFYLPIK